jgi:hypothetical protein
MFSKFFVSLLVMYLKMAIYKNAVIRVLLVNLQNLLNIIYVI